MVNTEAMKAGNPTESGSSKKKLTEWPKHFSNPKVDALANRLKKIFDALPQYGYLGPEDLHDYRYHETIILNALSAINLKTEKGLLHPLDIRSYPKILRYPDGIARIAIYIGSFDPFQMTHLSIALRYLAWPTTQSDMVIVVPEDPGSSYKPDKTDYAFRFQIAKLQLADLFEPFILPLDIGSGADTIEIVRRFIALHAGMKLELTHLIGSDVLPLAAEFLEKDLAVWRQQASRSGVDYRHRIYIARRTKKGSLAPWIAMIRKHNIEVILDNTITASPSSTDFRKNRHLTLVLPTPAIKDKLEILFRYKMSQSWSAVTSGKNSLQANPHPWEI